jgi:hypothetical protein
VSLGLHVPCSRCRLLVEPSMALNRCSRWAVDNRGKWQNCRGLTASRGVPPASRRGSRARYALPCFIHRGWRSPAMTTYRQPTLCSSRLGSRRFSSTRQSAQDGVLFSEANRRAAQCRDSHSPQQITKFPKFPSEKGHSEQSPILRPLARSQSGYCTFRAYLGRPPDSVVRPCRAVVLPGCARGRSE